MRRESSLTLIEHMRKLQVACGDLKTENARYREALEEIVRQNPPQPLGEKLVACGVCERVWLSGEPHTHKDTCYIGVAHRALHPERANDE